MSYKVKLFWLLWTAGMAGILSFLFVDLSALIAAMPQPDGPVELPPPALLKFLSVLQPTVLMTIAIWVGIFLAERVGLHAPAAEAAARGGGYFQALKPQIAAGVAVGLVGGVAIVATWVIAKPFFSTEFATRAQDFNKIIPHVVRFLYGGITEELLLRWGVMTFLVWVAWRLLQKGEGVPKPHYFTGAIILSAILFGVGHLPVAYALNGSLTLPVVLYVIAANSIFGLMAGFLYWRKGLEAAIIAHMFAHVVLITAIWLAI